MKIDNIFAAAIYYYIVAKLLNLSIFNKKSYNFYLKIYQL